MTLDQLPNNQQALIKSLPEDYQLSVSLMEQGFVPNTKLSVAHRAPFKGPIAVRINGTKIAINPHVARQIEVVQIP